MRSEPRFRVMSRIVAGLALAAGFAYTVAFYFVLMSR